MAVTEVSGLMKYKDANGNEYLMLPITTKDNVDGMEEIDAHLVDTNNPHGTTAEQIGAAPKDHDHVASDITGLSGVATSGSYNDLSDKPSIPEAYVHPESHPASMITGLGTLATKDTVSKSDLASDVQTSLGKADTALQSYTETDPTVPAWAKAATKPTYTASEVGAAAEGHTHDEQEVLHGITTAGDGATYTATVAGIDVLVAGATFIMVPHTVSTTTAPKLNVNGLGAKNIRRRVSNSTATTVAGSSASWLAANKPLRVIYDGTYWIADVTRPNATDIYGTVPITSGGTGATTAASALTNLGITYGTDDLTAGTSTLATGSFYFVYE